MNIPKLPFLSVFKHQASIYKVIATSEVCVKANLDHTGSPTRHKLSFDLVLDLPVGRDLDYVYDFRFPIPKEVNWVRQVNFCLKPCNAYIIHPLIRTLELDLFK